MITKAYTITDTTTGEVIETVFSTKNLSSVQADYPDNTVVAGEYEGDYWYRNGAVMAERPEFPIDIDYYELESNGTDTITLTGVPNGTEISVDTPPIAGQTSIDPFVVTDGFLTITTTIPGDYHLTARLFPYMDFEIDFDTV